MVKNIAFALVLIIVSITHATKTVPFCTDLNASNSLAYRYDPDFARNVTYLIISKGYPEEEHCVETEDGYILSIQRIPGGRTELEKNEKKEAVLLMHGLLSSASQYVLNFPDQSLGFVLADAGYDVWMGNNRGSTYSRRHVKYTPEMLEFWDFSFHEHGKYDLPAIIDYILNITGQTQLFYIGHSAGCSQALVLLSESKKYNEKIKLFVALAPGAFLRNTNGPFALLSPLAPLGHVLFYHFGVAEILAQSSLIKLFARYVCGTNFAKSICETLEAEFLGKDCQQLNTTRLGVYVTEFPSGTSLKAILHFFQIVNSKKFQMYDYYVENEKIYNQSCPPEYDLTSITAPVVLFSGKNDRLVPPEDVQFLASKLKNLIGNYLVPFPYFNHGDFAIAIDANQLLYHKIVELLNTY